MSFERILSLLEILGENTSAISPPRLEDQRAAFGELSAVARLRDVRSLVPHLLKCHETFREDLANLIRVLVCQGVYDPRTRLYDALRDVPKDTLLQLARHQIFDRAVSVHLWGIASLSECGFVRQEALQALGEIQHPEALPYVLLRLGDWVDEVHEEACIVLKRLLESASSAQIRVCFRLIQHQRLVRRRDLRVFLDDVVSHMVEGKNRTEAIDLLGQGPSAMRLFLCQSLGGAPDVLEAAFANKDARVRLWGLRQMEVNEECVDLLAPFFLDRAAFVRLDAFRRVPRNSFPKIRGAFERALFDPAKGVRDFARFALGQLGITDVATYYREVVTSQIAPSPTALMGLAQTGSDQDMEVLLMHLGGARGPSRATLLEALVRWGKSDLEDTLIQGLSDTNGRVRHTCAFLIQKRYRSLESHLKTMVVEAPSAVAARALSICVAFGGLGALEAILLALCRDDGSLQGKAWRHLAFWWERYYIQAWFKTDPQQVGAIWQLVKQIQASKIHVPGEAFLAWEGLPAYLGVLKKDEGATKSVPSTPPKWFKRFLRLFS